MICWTCGHLAKFHAEFLYPDKKVAGCKECYRSRANRSLFCKHPFEDNLEYLERKSNEKENVV